MLRRSVLRAQNYGREHARRRNQAVRQLIWNEDGTPNFKGVAYYLYDWIGVPVKIAVTCVVVIYFYTIMVVKLEKTNSSGVRQLQDSQIAKLRATGKLKSEQHLAIQNRQIDDPDYPNNLPGFSETYRSKILDNDAYADAVSGDERKYSH